MTNHLQSSSPGDHDVFEWISMHLLGGKGDFPHRYSISDSCLQGWQKKLDPEYDVMNTLRALLFKADWAESLFYTIEGLMAPWRFLSFSSSIFPRDMEEKIQVGGHLNPCFTCYHNFFFFLGGAFSQRKYLIAPLTICRGLFPLINWWFKILQMQVKEIIERHYPFIDCLLYFVFPRKWWVTPLGVCVFASFHSFIVFPDQIPS